MIGPKDMSSDAVCGRVGYVTLLCQLAVRPSPKSHILAGLCVAQDLHPTIHLRRDGLEVKGNLLTLPEGVTTSRNAWTSPPTLVF